MSFLELALLLDMTIDRINSIFTDSVILTHIVTLMSKIGLVFVQVTGCNQPISNEQQTNLLVSPLLPNIQ